MTNIKEISSRLLERQYEDFKKYVETEEFRKLLGIYEEETTNDKEKKKKLYNESLKNDASYMAMYLSSFVIENLKSFCEQNEFFASKVYSHSGNFTQCMAYTIHGFTKQDRATSLSDMEVYTRAIQYYYPEAEIKTVVKLQLPENAKLIELTDEQIAEKEKSYKALLDKAEAQKLAQEQAKAEQEAKRKLEEKKRAEKKAKQEAAKKRKAEKEALKKAQESLFTEVEENPFDNEKAASTVPKAVKKPKPQPPIETIENTETDEIQLDLFSNFGG